MRSNIQKHYEDTKKFFDEAALKRDGYHDEKDSIPYKTQQLVRNIVLTLLKVDKEKYNKILDAGCGNGEFTILLSQLFPASKITGADYSEGMIKLCEQTKIDNIEFKVADLLNTTFDDNEFDITVCINTIHHIHKKDLDRTIEEIARITKKTVILEIKNRNSLYYPIKKLRGRLLLPGLSVYVNKVKAMERLFGKYGFRLTDITPIFKFGIFSPIIVLKFRKGDWKRYNF
jgi:ubiquinone/menaquinone biosynthesis C-methylase UbiE